MPHTRSPQRGLIGARMQKTPEPEHQLRHHPTRHLRAAPATRTTPRLGNILLRPRRQRCRQIPRIGTPIAAVPPIELGMTSVAQDHLEVAKILEHRRTQASVPLVQIQRPIKITTGRREIRRQPLRRQQHPHRLRHGRATVGHIPPVPIQSTTKTPERPLHPTVHVPGVLTFHHPTPTWPLPRATRAWGYAADGVPCLVGTTER